MQFAYGLKAEITNAWREGGGGGGGGGGER